MACATPSRSLWRWRSRAAAGRRGAARASWSTTSRCGGSRPGSSAGASRTCSPPPATPSSNGGFRSPFGTAGWASGAESRSARSWASGACNGGCQTSRRSSTQRRPRCSSRRAIGRIGNYFNQELFGRPSDLAWAVQIDVEHRPARYLAEATFHPTFLYEATWNLLLAGVLVWLGRHRAIRPPGLFALYVAGYCGFRILDELLRVDPAAHVLGVRWNLLLAISGTLAGLTWFATTQRREPTPG